MSDRPRLSIQVRPLAEPDLEPANQLMRLAFATYLGIVDPQRSWPAGLDYAHPRFRAAPDAAFAAVHQGELVGASFGVRWGSLALFGPVMVRPDCWDQGVARALLEETLGLFARWGVGIAGLHTFPQSAKHVTLYQRLGFAPRFLTAIFSTPVAPGLPAPEVLSALSGEARQRALAGCREITEALHPGLDLGDALENLVLGGFGDGVLVREENEVVAFGVCHTGAGSEAGAGTCFVKFGAARPGANAARRFDALLQACLGLASARGLGRVIAGVSTARREAYGTLLERRWRVEAQGVSMHRPDLPAHCREGVWALDDWR